MRAVPCAQASFVLVDAVRRELAMLVSSSGETQRIRVPIGKGLMGTVARSKKMLLADNAASDARVQEAIAASTGRLSARSEASNASGAVHAAGGSMVESASEASSARPTRVRLPSTDYEENPPEGSLLIFPVLAPATAAARQFARRTGTTEQLQASRRCLGVL